MEANNMAKMREALEFADKELRNATEDDRFGDDLVYLVGCMRTVAAVCRAALAAPPRNCDMGTAEERTKRYHEFCRGRVCETCPALTAEKDDLEDGSCIIQWEDMPYEEGGAK